MFRLLDEFYKSSNDECLGNLLSGFNPFLFSDEKTADPAAWDDWMSTVKKITDKDSLNEREAFFAACEFVKFHQEGMNSFVKRP